MEKATTQTQQIEDERIKFVRETIVEIEEEDLLAKPLGSCPNSKSVIDIEQVVTYKPLPIEEAKLEQEQNNFNLGKLCCFWTCTVWSLSLSLILNNIINIGYSYVHYYSLVGLNRVF